MGPLLSDGLNLGGSAPAPDPARGDVDEVKARVEADPGSAGDVLAAEEGGRGRVTLVEWLRARLRAAEEAEREAAARAEEEREAAARAERERAAEAERASLEAEAERERAASKPVDGRED